MRCLSETDLRMVLDGELPARRQPRSEAHLTECERCRLELARLRRDEKKASRALDLLEPERIPASAAEILHEGMRRKRSRTPNILSARVTLPLPFLAGLVALLLVMAGIVFHQRHAINQFRNRPETVMHRLELVTGSDKSVQGQMLDVDLNGFVANPDPTITVVKEKES